MIESQPKTEHNDTELCTRTSVVIYVEIHVEFKQVHQLAKEVALRVPIQPAQFALDKDGLVVYECTHKPPCGQLTQQVDHELDEAFTEQQRPISICHLVFWLLRPTILKVCSSIVGGQGWC